MGYMFVDNGIYYGILTKNEVNPIWFEKHGLVEIDELILHDIVALCNKGYLTEQCCAGHCGADIMRTNKDEESLIDQGLFSVIAYDEEIGSDCIYYQVDVSDPEAFILFRDNIKFDHIPNGWLYKNRRLSTERFSYSSPADYYHKLTEYLLELENWIDSLPERIN